MSNACFRCKTPIESGGTFCSDCHDRIQFGGFQYTGVSRWWIGVVVFGSIQILVGLGYVAMLYLGGTGIGPAVGIALFTAFWGAPFFWYALLKDAEHIRARDDVDWSPSKYGYWGLAFLATFTLPTPLVIAYHLKKRMEATGLPVRKSTA